MFSAISRLSKLKFRNISSTSAWSIPVRFLNLLPLSHVFGQFLGIFLPQLMGGTVIFQDALKPGEVIRTIRRERVSVLVAVPRMLQSLKEKIERDLEEEGELEDFRAKFRTRRRESISSAAGGSSGACIASWDGSSGHSSPAARRSTA